VLRFLIGERDPSKVRLLFLGAHCDDIEIGCGASALRLLREWPGASVHWVVFGSTPERAAEAEASAADFLAGAGQRRVEVLAFTDSYFPSQQTEIKKRFEALKAVEPHVIFTHCRHDLHQDHRVVCELTWNTFRDHAILEYEVPKYDGDLASPNFFIPVDAETARTKARLLRQHFGTQRGRHWFDDDLFLGLMRIRGAECRAPQGFAEGFYARKVVM
jgi:LmbE family N-acetylglucosaminyl deacetylase